MQLKSLVALGLAAVSLTGPLDAAPRKGFLSARFSYDEKREPYFLAEIRRQTERRISFNGHFSEAFVSCGIACGSYYFVDRWTGGVAMVPESPLEREMTWDVVARPDSDRIKVVYGPRDGVDNGKCWTHSFRWAGKRFVPVGKRSTIRCPH